MNKQAEAGEDLALLFSISIVMLSIGLLVLLLWMVKP